MYDQGVLAPEDIGHQKGSSPLGEVITCLEEDGCGYWRPITPAALQEFFNVVSKIQLWNTKQIRTGAGNLALQLFIMFKDGLPQA